jgi:hypothetical protein
VHTPEALQPITAFLTSIGIPLEIRRLDSSTFLPGVMVEKGVVVYDPELLAWPGDLLHEAGHIAVTPARLRRELSGAIPAELRVEHADEPEATAWAFAAVRAIGLDPAVLFHEGGYRGKSTGLIFTFMAGGYPGLAGLSASGMALSPIQAAASGDRSYPSMVRWLRE